MAIFLKDPGARLDYAIDWSAGYLGNEAITDSVWQVAPSAAGAVVVDASSVSAGRTAVTVSGGLPGFVYRVANLVTFSDGRRDERTLVVRVEER